MGSGVVACHECDLLHSIDPLPEHSRACCRRCGSELYRHMPNSRDTLLALYLAALMLFIMANLYPLLSLEFGGRVEEMVLVSGALKFFSMGMEELGILVLLTSVLFPLITIGGMLYLLLALRFGFEPPLKAPLYRLLVAILPWSLLGVFMLGILVSVVKLLDLANVIPGISLFALAGLLLVVTTARYLHDPRAIWPLVGYREAGRELQGSAAGEGLAHCHVCGLLSRDHGRYPHCGRCGAPLHRRKHNSIARTWALLATATLLFFPANIYPVMTVTQFGRSDSSTILGGVVKLIEAGMWPLALLVFFASIVVPVLKLVVMSMLLITVQRGSQWRLEDRTRLYRLTEAVGSWSMVDVYLVAILSALVDLDMLTTIRPEIGVTFFAAVVVVTIVAAQSFDPRSIWDSSGGELNGEPG